MSAVDHPAYREENERLQYTLEQVETSKETLTANEARMAKEVTRAKRSYRSDNSQDYIDLIVNTTLHQGYQLKLRNLESAQSKPYFARIDFHEKGKAETSRLYIGKMCLIEENSREIIIVDWRAPVANLYYEGRLGECGYLCPEGKIEGDLLLKRQFMIDDGVLHEIFDIDITTNDEFLQSYLGASADNRLKEIVSTIQAEQNQIIRANMETPLIIQGVAGSGKTTIALHRIAFLIYNYQHFQPENFMIVAPNRLFLNYISEVLPELGVERVKQTTFEDLALELIGVKLKVRDTYQKLVAFVNPHPSKEQAGKNLLEQAASEFKSSFRFKEVLESYASQIEQSILPREAFGVGNWILYSVAEIQDLYFHDYRQWPFYQRIEQLLKHFKKRLKEQKEARVGKLQLHCDREIIRIKMEMPESEARQSRIIRLIEQKEKHTGRIAEFASRGVKDYSKKIVRYKAVDYYKKLFGDAELFRILVGERLDDATREYVRESTLKNLNAGWVEYEDLAPLIYLQYLCYGWGEHFPVKHMVIDEAQDFSIFQFYVMKRIVKDSTFTILGDLSQGIHSYRGIQDWEQLRELVFGTEPCELLTLEQTYRTSIEIMEAANRVIRHLREFEPVMAKPVIRHGKPVEIRGFESFKALCEAVAAQVTQWVEQSWKSMAIICKTGEEGEKIAAHLQDVPARVTLITGKEEEYYSGLVVVPSYLAKGLEFDVALVASANRESYQETDLDIKLLYVAMTRPLHELCIFYHGEPTPLLQ